MRLREGVNNMGLAIKGLIVAAAVAAGLTLSGTGHVIKNAVASDTNNNHGSTVSVVAKGHGAAVSAVAKNHSDNHGADVSAVAKGHGAEVSAVAK
jgi:hypothetical protein